MTNLMQVAVLLARPPKPATVEVASRVRTRSELSAPAHKLKMSRSAVACLAQETETPWYLGGELERFATLVHKPY